MKMIDVLNMMAKGEIKHGTKLITDDDLDDYAYQYSELHQAFMNRYMNRIEDEFFLDEDFLNIEVELIPPKKKYLIKLTIRGLNDENTYLNRNRKKNIIFLSDNSEGQYSQTKFTKQEMQSIQPVKEFLEDMEGKYELIEVKE